MKTVIKLILLSFLNLNKFFRKVTLSKFKVLIRALKNEPANQIIHNFKLLLNTDNRKSSISVSQINKKSREDILKEKQDELNKYLNSKSKITFSENEPELTIVMVLFNKAELTLACLKSLSQNSYNNYELIIVDNNSTDQTKDLLETISGVRIIYNDSNLHFLKANNQVIDYINGKYTLFLNNDTILNEDTLINAIETIKRVPSCGAVGAKIILPDGSLQEAGSIIWKDGSCLGYGRSDNPDLPEYNFLRATDYCSGAFLLTLTELFREHGGFDPIFEPAYYEETDYCLWLSHRGYKVVYNPKVVINHFEFGSGVSERAIELHKINQKKFFEKNKEKLERQLMPNLNNTLIARFSSTDREKKKVLYIDDRVPHIDFGSGFPRSNYIINSICSLGYHVTAYPLNFPFEDNWENAYRDIDSSIEIAVGYGINRFEEFIKSRFGYFDIIWISRPHNFEAIYKSISLTNESIKIIYDAEAIFSEREILQKEKEGKALSKFEKEEIINNEISLAKKAHIIIVVSDKDASTFLIQGIFNVKILGHCLKTEKCYPVFSERDGLLFVGNLDYNDSPNVDSLIWFIDEIWPLIKKQIPSITLDIIGSAKSNKIQKINSAGIKVHGKMDDIKPFYNKCRLFIAPTRYAAGIPYKIHEAAANGLPSVVTELLSKQLGWENNKEIWSVNAKADEFAQMVISSYNDENNWGYVQKKMIDRIEKEMSEEKYMQTLKEILDL